MVLDLFSNSETDNGMQKDISNLVNEMYQCMWCSTRNDEPYLKILLRWNHPINFFLARYVSTIRFALNIGLARYFASWDGWQLRAFSWKLAAQFEGLAHQLQSIISHASSRRRKNFISIERLTTISLWLPNLSSQLLSCWQPIRTHLLLHPQSCYELVMQVYVVVEFMESLFHASWTIQLPKRSAHKCIR